MTQPSEISGLIERGEQRRRDGRSDAARQDFAAAVAMARPLGPSSDLVRALGRLADAHNDLGESEDALKAREEAVAAARPLADPLLVAHTLRHLGDTLQRAGTAQAASPPYAEALELYRAHAAEVAPLDFANALRSFALHAQALGDRDGARNLWEEARERYLDADPVLQRMTGGNPGLAEADRRLASL